MSNLFEQASRQKLRFPSTKGDLTAENLWDLQLTAKNGFSLDDVAKTIHGDLQLVGETSFVETKANPRKTELTLKLELVKHVIAVRQHEAKLASEASAKSAERQKLLGALESKREQELANLTPEEIEAKLRALDE